MFIELSYRIGQAGRIVQIQAAALKAIGNETARLKALPSLRLQPVALQDANDLYDFLLLSTCQVTNDQKAHHLEILQHARELVASGALRNEDGDDKNCSYYNNFQTIGGALSCYWAGQGEVRIQMLDQQLDAGCPNSRPWCIQACHACINIECIQYDAAHAQLQDTYSSR